MNKLLSKLVYKLLLKFTGSKKKLMLNKTKKMPVQSFYNLNAVVNNGQRIDFATLKGKKVLIVNTASECGYTPQYEELQELYSRYGDKLAILGFPANDFGAQEPASNEEIAQFCKINYGVTFPIMQKSTVIKGGDQNPVFAWLTDSTLNGWNDQQPEWNFNKYLVDEVGVLQAYFPSGISPVSEELLEAIGVR